MGFSKEASQIKRIGNITLEDIPGFIKVDFSPPVDYSEDKLERIVRELQDRFLQHCTSFLQAIDSKGLKN